MKNFSIVSIALAGSMLFLAPAQAYWNPNEADSIVDRHPAVIVDALASRGIKVDRLEEYNDLVLAFVVEDDGGASLQFFDPENGYQRVYPGGR